MLFYTTFQMFQKDDAVGRTYRIPFPRIYVALILHFDHGLRLSMGLERSHQRGDPILRSTTLLSKHIRNLWRQVY